MKLFVCAVNDRAMDAFTTPFHSPAQTAAIRAFKDEVNRKDSPPNKHPEDYELYCLGTFDDKTGLFATGTPELLARGKDLVVSVH